MSAKIAKGALFKANPTGILEFVQEIELNDQQMPQELREWGAEPEAISILLGRRLMEDEILVGIWDDGVTDEGCRSMGKCWTL